jgi:hypothetical protein
MQQGYRETDTGYTGQKREDQGRGILFQRVLWRRLLIPKLDYPDPICSTAIAAIAASSGIILKL